jgi:hypothetical protein
LTYPFLNIILVVIAVLTYPSLNIILVVIAVLANSKKRAFGNKVRNMSY